MNTRPCVVLGAVMLLLPIGRYSLGQSQWTPQETGQAGYMTAVAPASMHLAWLTTSGPVAVYGTTDGGDSWERWDTSGFTDWVTHDLAVTETGVLLAASSRNEATAILRSEDGGITWSEAYRIEGAGSYINGVRMTSSTEGVAVADPIGGSWVVVLTTDGGRTWQPSPTSPAQAMGSVSPEKGWEHSVAALPGGYIWFGTDNSRVYRSTDGGVSWSHGTIPSFDAYGVAFTDPLTGIAACGNGLARTADGGASWAHINSVAASYYADVVGVNGCFWAVKGQSILESTDDGVTWGNPHTGTGNYRRINAVNEGGTITGWAIGEQLVRFTLSPTGAEAGREIPRSIQLLQNYPNPFNPSTTIRYGLPSRSHVMLTVFNTLGQQVATLVQGEQEAGYHEAVLDASHLASGVYLYQLRAGTVVDARRMMLVK